MPPALESPAAAWLVTIEPGGIQRDRQRRCRGLCHRASAKTAVTPLACGVTPRQRRPEHAAGGRRYLISQGPSSAVAALAWRWRGWAASGSGRRAPVYPQAALCINSYSRSLGAKGTCFGFYALDQSEPVQIRPASWANGETTCQMLQRLRLTYPDQPLILFWDNVSYHRAVCARELARLPAVSCGLPATYRPHRGTAVSAQRRPFGGA